MIRLLLLLPFIGLLWIPFYNERLPELFGFPFFYWYQLAWVPVSAAITWIVWLAEPLEPKVDRIGGETGL